MITEQMVDAIVTRLAPLGVDVRPMPDKPSRKLFVHPVATIWVGFNGAQYDQPEALSHPVQNRRPQFDLGVLVRQLHGPKGATVVLDAIRDALHGWTLPVGGAPLVMVREQFVDYEDGVWRYDVVVASGMPAVPVAETEVLPLFAEITLESDYGETTIPEEP